MECACGQQLNLWKTVENPVDKPKVFHKVSPPMPPPSKKDISLIAREAIGDLNAAVLDALDVLSARVDFLEFQIAQLQGEGHSQ